MKWVKQFFHKLGDFILYNLLSAKFWFAVAWMVIAGMSIYYKTTDAIWFVLSALLFTLLVFFMKEYQKPDNNLYKTIHDWLAKK